MWMLELLRTLVRLHLLRGKAVLRGDAVLRGKAVLRGDAVLRGKAMWVMNRLRRCPLRTRWRMTISWVLARARLSHCRMDIGIIHGRVGHICEAILGSRGRRRGSVLMRTQIGADTANVVS
jgi:hypothetical protein